MANLNSHHFFLFPFSWENKVNSKRNNISLFDKTDLKSVEDKIDKRYWEKFNFSFKIDEGTQTYNDFIYFYDQVRDVLLLSDEKKEVSGLQFQYKSELLINGKYIIGIKKQKDIELDLKDIYVNFYESGVGIFVFYIENYSESDFNRILKINEYGRRIFPQFLGGYDPYTDATKNSFLSTKISLKNIISQKSIIEEDFSYYDRLDHLNSEYFRLPNHIGSLLGDNFSGNTKDKSEDKIYMLPVLDDRMFVISHVFNKDLIQKWSDFNEHTKQYHYQTSNDWYRYLYVDDSNASCTSVNMLNKQLTQQSYDRWIASKNFDNKGKITEYFGQLYGISRYSFVLLGGEDWFNRNIICSHIKNMYFQMVLLGLLQRTYIINFGNEVSRIGKNLHHKNLKTQNIRDINELYLAYIKFRNRIFYREITSQEQGIELYDLLQKTLRIDHQVKDLDDEIRELNEYVQSLENSRLSSVASLFLPVTLLAGILGMNIFSAPQSVSWTLKNIDWKLTLFMLFSVIAMLWTGVVTFKYLFDKKIKK
jgi:hypothetical protein